MQGEKQDAVVSTFDAVLFKFGFAACMLLDVLQDCVLSVSKCTPLGIGSQIHEHGSSAHARSSAIKWHYLCTTLSFLQVAAVEKSETKKEKKAPAAKAAPAKVEVRSSWHHNHSCLRAWLLRQLQNWTAGDIQPRT